MALGVKAHAQVVMNFIPDPLHPAVVHFPIVLILVGTLLAVVAAFWRWGALPAVVAGCLAFGALGVWVAIQTGESDGGLLESLGTQAESLVEAHERWAERTLIVTTVAAFASIASALLFRFPRVARSLGAVAALVACLASYSVYETGHRGGALVFWHGAGVNVTSGADPLIGAGAEFSRTPSREPAADEDRD